MDQAKTLVRTVVRAFYTTEHVLIIDALAIHSTLTDADLAHLLGMQTKALRRLSAKLKEDGLVSVQARGEKKEGAPPSYHMSNGNQQPKERLFFRDWYYMNFHRAIDSIKYRLWKLNRHVESLGAPTEEKKDLICPRCKSTYTELEVMDNLFGDGFHCHRCSHVLEPQEESSGPAENETMKRMNDQLAPVLALMRTIDATTVPENDFDTALRHHVPVERPDTHPGARTTIVDDARARGAHSIASSKGLALAPEKVSVNLTEEKVDAGADDAAQRAERREHEARQNLLPEWISKSTLTGDLTNVGAKEAAERRRRELDHGTSSSSTADGVAAAAAAAASATTPTAAAVDGALPDEKKAREIIDNAAMAEYFKELKAAQAKERFGVESDDDDEDGDDDDDDDDDDDGAGFEDVVGVAPKRIKVEEGSSSSTTALGVEPGGDGRAGNVANGSASSSNGKAVGNGPAAAGGGGDEAGISDADDDDDELEFEDV